MGRFGDSCKKIKFIECTELVDKQKEVEYNAKLLRYVTDLKKRVQVRPAVLSQKKV